MRESKIKTKCKDNLKSWGWMVIHLMQTNLNGIPDTLALRNGKMVFIEFKKPGEIVYDDGLQKYRHDKLRKQGFEVIIASSVQAIDHLK